MSKNSKNEHTESERIPPQEATERSDKQEEQGETEDPTRILESQAAESQKRIAELQVENFGAKRPISRKLADYENFRKRMFREKDEAVQFANSSILQDLLGILDDFDRAIQSSEVSRDFQILHDGIGMVRNRMLSTLEGKYGLARYESEGKLFDPHIHEAVAMDKGAVEEPIVSEEFLKGYTLNGRVLRAAKVRVRMPGGETDTAPGEPAPEKTTGPTSPESN